MERAAPDLAAVGWEVSGSAGPARVVADWAEAVREELGCAAVGKEVLGYVGRARAVAGSAAAMTEEVGWGEAESVGSTAAAGGGQLSWSAEAGQCT